MLFFSSILSNWALLRSKFVQSWLFWVWEHFSTWVIHYSLSESQRRSRNYFQTNTSFFASMGPTKLCLKVDFSFIIFHHSVDWCCFHFKIYYFLNPSQECKINFHVHFIRQILTLLKTFLNQNILLWQKIGQIHLNKSK